MEITDRMIDDFYGEYEAPSYGTGKHLTCWNCYEEIYDGESYTRLPDYDENAGEIICEKCAHDLNVLESIFRAVPESVKPEVLGMEMEVYCG